MKRLLNDNESIHEGVRMNKEYRSKKSLERRFWSADIYVGIGLLMTHSTKGASGQGVSLKADHDEAIEALFWSATATNPSRCAFR